MMGVLINYLSVVVRSAFCEQTRNITVHSEMCKMKKEILSKVILKNYAKRKTNWLGRIELFTAVSSTTVRLNFSMTSTAYKCFFKIIHNSAPLQSHFVLEVKYIVDF